jgi:hypothetical protein
MLAHYANWISLNYSIFDEVALRNDLGFGRIAEFSRIASDKENVLV